MIPFPGNRNTARPNVALPAPAGHFHLLFVHRGLHVLRVKIRLRNLERQLHGSVIIEDRAGVFRAVAVVFYRPQSLFVDDLLCRTVADGAGRRNRIHDQNVSRVRLPVADISRAVRHPERDIAPILRGLFRGQCKFRHRRPAAVAERQRAASDFPRRCLFMRGPSAGLPLIIPFHRIHAGNHVVRIEPHTHLRAVIAERNLIQHLIEYRLAVLNAEGGRIRFPGVDDKGIGHGRLMLCAVTRRNCHFVICIRIEAQRCAPDIPVSAPAALFFLRFVRNRIALHIGGLHQNLKIIYAEIFIRHRNFRRPLFIVTVLVYRRIPVIGNGNLGRRGVDDNRARGKVRHRVSRMVAVFDHDLINTVKPAAPVILSERQL